MDKSPACWKGWGNGRGSQGGSQDVPGCEESRQGELKATVQGDYWSGLEKCQPANGSS